MKIKYNETYEEYICGVCGYKHMIKYPSHPDRYSIDSGYGKKPFKKSETPFICSENDDIGYGCIEKCHIYACPECGTLQINTN